MIRRTAKKLQSFFTTPPSHVGRKRGSKLAVATFTVMFLLGYSLTGTVVQVCNAQPTGTLAPPAPPLFNIVGGPCVPFAVCIPGTPPVPVPVPCITRLTTNAYRTALINNLRTLLRTSTQSLESSVTGLDAMGDQTVDALLGRLRELEWEMIKWWDTMWYYQMLPGLQAMTRQLNAGLTDAVRTLQSVTDAGNTAMVDHVQQQRQLKSHRNYRASDNACVAATAAGGYGRATGFARAMRKAWQKESQGAGLNTQGSLGAAAGAETEGQRYKDYRDMFCDPGANAGRNTCPVATKPEFYGADAQPTKFIYNQLTIDVTNPANKPELAKAVEAINNNLVGTASADPILQGSLNSAPGQQAFLDRRAFLAKYAAVRSIPQMITGWRMPGGGPNMAAWVKELRQGAGLSAGVTFSENPSYREILHAVSIDKFNSQKYAMGLITDENAVEMEKLTLNAFYLMQLRDYYELLERTALTLAVQVSLMADMTPLPDPVSMMPKK